MIARYQTLSNRIKLELDGMKQTIQAIQRHWAKVETSVHDQDAYLNSVAINLHGFYTGLERLFELIAIELDGGTLGGDAWHTELLKQMTLDIDKVRPPVLEAETADLLNEYRKFRHLVRNIYTLNLDPSRVGSLVSGLDGLWDRVKRELLAFSGLLENLANAD